MDISQSSFVSPELSGPNITHACPPSLLPTEIASDAAVRRSMYSLEVSPRSLAVVAYTLVMSPTASPTLPYTLCRRIVTLSLNCVDEHTANVCTCVVVGRGWERVVTMWIGFMVRWTGAEVGASQEPYCLSEDIACARC